jgi:hypothetical protein
MPLDGQAGVTLAEYLAFAINAAATTCPHSMVAWHEAMETSHGALGLLLRTTQRPMFWQAVPDARFAAVLLSSNDAIGSADVQLGDGMNTMVVCISRPMWARGPDMHTEGSFCAILEQSLGLVHESPAAVPLAVDVNDPMLKLKAASASIRDTVYELDAASVYCGLFRSASSKAAPLTLVRVRADRAFATSRVPNFPDGVVTPELVRDAVGRIRAYDRPFEKSGIITHGFPCSFDEHLLMVCAPPVP